MPRSPACRASAVQSSTLSHGMCTAMRGATPVKRCTCAASSAFSHGVRGTPGWPNTLNRVPEFPNAQEGSSISCPFSAALTAVRSRIWCSSPLSVHVKYLADPLEPPVGPDPLVPGPVLHRPAARLDPPQKADPLHACSCLRDCGYLHPL